VIPRQLWIGLDPETREVERFDWYDDAASWAGSAGDGGPPLVLFGRQIVPGRVILQPELTGSGRVLLAKWIPPHYWPEAFRLMADRDLIQTGTSRLRIRQQEIAEAEHEARVAMFATGFESAILVMQ
jgi:hypothetical protein